METTTEGDMSRIKVAIACSGLDHVLRGVETWSLGAFKALRERGVDVTLFQGSGRNGLPEVQVVHCAKRGSRLAQKLPRLMPAFSWRLGLGSPYQVEQTTFSAKMFFRVFRQYDILHTKDPVVALIFHTAHRLGLSRARVILNHGTEEPPDFLSHLDYVQHLAPFHREEAVQQGVQLKRHLMVPNFVDLHTFTPGNCPALREELGIPQEAFVVLSVAALKRSHKRLDWLVQEVAGLPAGRREQIYVLLVGAETEETENLVRWGRSLLGQRLVVLTDRPRQQMPQIYQAADVFALCSLKEMLPNAVLEAMASGLPAIGSQYPVSRWMIGDGGESIDMEVEGRLAAELEAYSEPGRRREVGMRARENVERRFSKDIVIRQQIHMYHEVLSD